MYRRFYFLLLLFLVYLIPVNGLIYSALGQEIGNVIVVSKKVGSVIYLYERNHYLLFPEIEGFNKAMFYQLPDSTYSVKIVFVTDGNEQTKLLKNLSGGDIERVRERIDNFDEIQKKTYEDGKKQSAMPEQILKKQPIALAVHFGYYMPSLKEVNRLVSDMEENQFPSGPYVGIRAVFSMIPKVLVFGEYTYWESIVEGSTELYSVDLRLKVQSVHFTGLYQIYGDLFAIGGGIGIYFGDYTDTYVDFNYNEVVQHWNNQAVGLHLCAGLFEWPNSKLFNLSVEGRYIFATIGETSDGFPKTELSGPMISASIMF